MSAALSRAQDALAGLVAAYGGLLDDVDLSGLLRDPIDWLDTHSTRLKDVHLSDLQRVSALDLPLFDLQLSFGLLCCYSALAICVITLLLSLFLRRSPPKAPDSPRLRAPLNALLSFAAPTTSSWPDRYLSIAQRSAAGPSAALHIPLSGLLDDVASGVVELRAAPQDLPQLMSGALVRHGWTILPRVGLSWRVFVAFRVACMRLAVCIPSLSYDTADVNTLSVKYSGLGKLLDKPSAPADDPAADMTLLSLDAVPVSQLKIYIRNVQASLPPGSSAMVGFSTLGGSVSYLSAAFVHASLPYFARKHITGRRNNAALPLDGVISGRTPSLDMQPTPLSTSLDHILRLLSSGATPLSVESVENVSGQYASYLDRYVQDLTELPAVRARFVARWGMAGWREERLLVAWEAATFRAGLMSRWAVYVTRRA